MGFYWPESAQKRAEYLSIKRSRPADAQSVYQCNPGAREGSVFLESDFAYYTPPPELDLGMHSALVRAFVSKGHLHATAWDTSYDAKSTSDPTVGVTGLLIPCQQYHCGESVDLYGECEPHFDVLILNLVRKHVVWGELVRMFREENRLWQPHVHLVEQKGTGITLYQTMPAMGINIQGVQAQESKRERALQGVGAGSVQGWFRQHRVLFPREAPWFDDLKRELKDFTGDGAGHDDQVDATVHLVTYAIQLGSSSVVLPSEWTPDRVDELMGVPSNVAPEFEAHAYSSGAMTDAAVMWSLLGGLQSLHEDRFEGTCGRCGHYSSSVLHAGNGVPHNCRHRKVVTTALDSCYDFEPVRH